MFSLSLVGCKKDEYADYNILRLEYITQTDYVAKPIGDGTYAVVKDISDDDDKEDNNYRSMYFIVEAKESNGKFGLSEETSQNTIYYTADPRNNDWEIMQPNVMLKFSAPGDKYYLKGANPWPNRIDFKYKGSFYYYGNMNALVE